jgi:hypothetical protein
MTNFLKGLPYLAALVAIFVIFMMAVGYVFQTISINSARISDLQGIDNAIRDQAAEIARNPPPEKLNELKAALSDLNAQHVGKQKEIDYGNNEFYFLTFRQCLLPIDPKCFHRKSSADNIQLLAVACGLLGVCLFFFVTLRKDAFLPDPVLVGPKVLISAVCLIPTGAILGLMTLFLMRGAKGALLSPVSNVVQVESPFGVAFACIFAAFFSDQILAALLNVADKFGIKSS